MAPIRLKLCQNAFQTIPDISFFDAGPKNKFGFVANFEDPFTPRGWLRLARKLWENAFQMIPDISFFDAEKV